MGNLNKKEVEICRKIDEMYEEVIEFLKELISINSEVPPGNYKNIIEFYTNKVKEYGFEVKIIEKPGSKKPNVLARLPGTTGTPTLIYNGHLDTVPGGEGWEPFKVKIRNGKLYGRGAMDCKGMVTAYTMAAKALKDVGLKLKGNLDLLSIVDDEVGGDDTWHYIVEKKLLKGDTIIAEGGGQDVIVNCSSTVLVLEIIVKGRATHAQTEVARKRGINAILKMNKVIDAINNYNKILELKNSKIPNLERCYMNIALVKGGIEGIWNIFPEKCIMQMELRLVPEYNPSGIIEEIKEVIKNLTKEDPELNVEVKELWRVPGFYVPDNLPIIKILKKYIRRITGNDVKIGGLGGFVPLGHFKEIGISGVTWNPGIFNECNLHQIDENLDIKHLINSTKVFALTAMRYLSY